HEGWNSCYADLAAAEGLARLIEGPLRGWQDLAAAELGLQALLWHDRVDFLIPSVCVKNDGYVGYARAGSQRSKLCLDLFARCEPRDYLFPTELVDASGGRVIASSVPDSKLVGHSLEGLGDDYLALSPSQVTAFAELPAFMKVP